MDFQQADNNTSGNQKIFALRLSITHAKVF